MKKVIPLLILVFSLAVSAAAQDGPARRVRSGASLPASPCNVSSASTEVFILLSGGASVEGEYYCKGGIWTKATADAGVTNSAGSNVIPKSNGTNLVSSSLSDTGSAVTSSVFIATPAFEPLTDGATITWAFSGAQYRRATVTLGGNRALVISGATNGAEGCLIVTQDGTGGRTLAVPAGSKVINGGAGVVTLTTASGAKDIICFAYDGTNYFWNYGLGYN
jgi:hypothetical protein